MINPPSDDFAERLAVVRARKQRSVERRRRVLREKEVAAETLVVSVADIAGLPDELLAELRPRRLVVDL